VADGRSKRSCKPHHYRPLIWHPIQTDGFAADPAVQIRGLNWAYVLMGVADGTLLPFIPLYLFERGLNAAWIGLVLAVAASASLAMGLAWAYLADRRFSPSAWSS